MSVLYKGRGSGLDEGELLLIDHDRRTINSIFEDTTDIKLQKELESLNKTNHVQKKFKPVNFKLSKEHDKRHEPICKEFDDSFIGEKYSVNTTYSTKSIRFKIE